MGRMEEGRLPHLAMFSSLHGDMRRKVVRPRHTWEVRRKVVRPRHIYLGEMRVRGSGGAW